MTSTKQDEAADKRAKARASKRKLAKRIKLGLLLLLGAAAIASLVFALLPKPIPVDLATAERRVLLVTVNEDGKTQAKSRFVLSAPLAGNMNKIHLKAGDSVVEGEAILHIVPALPPLLDKRTRADAQSRLGAAKAGLGLARADVLRARAAAEHAESEATRIGAMGTSGIAAGSEVSLARFAAKARKQELRAAQFSAKVRVQDEASARAALGLLDKRGKGEGQAEGLDIVAPVSGKILRVLREDEQGLVAGGAPLLEIADLESMEIVADILTADAIEIEVGAKARIVRWGGAKELVGHVRRVEPSAFTRISALGVEEQRVFVIIDLDSPLEDWRALGDGYRVEVEITVWHGESILSVPAPSLFRHEGEWAVYTFEDDHAKLTTVKTGHRNDLWVEITSGLEEGTIVVAHPSDRVVDGVLLSRRGE